MANITLSTGLDNNGQFPVDGKTRILTIGDLTDLGAGSIKAYSYYELMPLYCIENKTEYVWREELSIGENGGAVPNSFTYPNGVISDGIDYSNRTFNFFIKNVFPVTSVNGKVGDITLDTGDILEGSNKYFTDSRVESNTAVIANSSKVGISIQQASDILQNNSKVSDINHVQIDLPNADNTSDIDKPISNDVQNALNFKQTNLVSGVNIKTINGGSILGTGDLDTNPAKYSYNLSIISSGVVSINASNSIRTNVTFDGVLPNLELTFNNFPSVKGEKVHEIRLNSTSGEPTPFTLPLGVNLTKLDNSDPIVLTTPNDYNFLSVWYLETDTNGVDYFIVANDYLNITI